MDLNLAREPFVNERPLFRISRALLVLGVVLAAVNVFLFWGYLSGSSELRGQIRETRDQIAVERQTLASLRSELVAFDLEDQNERVEFLNDRIRERTFPWGMLFERLGEVLPARVRIDNLTPVVDGRDVRRRRRRTDPELEGRVSMQLDGLAENTEQLLEFVDRLFAHEAFEQPKLESEARDEGNIRFNLRVRYLPYQSAASAPTSEAVEMTSVEPGATDTSASAPESAASSAGSTAPSSGMTPSSETAVPSPSGASRTALPPAEDARAEQPTSTGAEAPSVDRPSERTIVAPSPIDPGSAAATAPEAARSARPDTPTPGRTLTAPVPRRGATAPSPRSAPGSSTGRGPGGATSAGPSVPAAPVPRLSNASSPPGRR